MEFKKSSDRIWLEDETGATVAFVSFPARDDATVEIRSTRVDPSLRGQGIASKLLEALARELRARGLKGVPLCSYAAWWFEQHPDQADLVQPAGPDCPQSCSLF